MQLGGRLANWGRKGGGGGEKGENLEFEIWEAGNGEGLILGQKRKVIISFQR